MAETPTTLDSETLHSIVNCLAIVVSFADLIAEEIPGTEVTQRSVEEIKQAAAKAARLLGRPLAVD